MANEEHVSLLRQGVDVWNAWRCTNPDIRPDLVGSSFFTMDFRRANFKGANLTGMALVNLNLADADLAGATVMDVNLINSNLSGANLTGANLSDSNLRSAKLHDATLVGARLQRAILFETKFKGANLNGADLSGASLVNADFRKSNLTGCRIYGVSAWGLQLEGAIQDSLIITPRGKPKITVDNVEIAQFVYLLLRNEKIRDIIDTMTSKAVLILGRFTSERKKILEMLRGELRRRQLAAVLYA
ncbi:pentapeptide repeat-containing protein [Rhizobium leguminosarum]|nr:pentapeptide repeat-containing protein [Rhizobium leguminosarum]